MPAPELSGARWRNTVAAVLARDAYTCRVPRDGVMCTRPAVTADHIVPRAAGGAPYDPGNLRAACLICHSHTSGPQRPEFVSDPAYERLSRRQIAIVYALDTAGVAHTAGRRTAARALPHVYGSSDIDAACTWRRQRGPIGHVTDGGVVAG